MDVAGTGVDDVAAAGACMINSLTSNTLSEREQSRVYLQFCALHFGFETMCTNSYPERLQ